MLRVLRSKEFEVGLDATFAQLFEDEELLDFVLPIVQADFAIVDSYKYRDRAGLRIPLLVFHGTEDQTVDSEKVKDWQEEGQSRFQICSFPGDHFFFAKQEQEVMSVAVDFLYRSPS